MLLSLGCVLTPGMFLLASDDLQYTSKMDKYDSSGNDTPQPVYRVNTNGRKLVALTLDDGPDPRFTPQVLDILRNYHVPATFFVIGSHAQKCPELISRMINEGHEVENHTNSHADLDQCSKPQIGLEIQQNEDTIERITHRNQHFFRPPKGICNPNIMEIAAQKGYKTVLWTICIERSTLKTSQELAQRVIQAAAPGVIILGHDGNLDRTKTVDALPIIIESYQEAGYKFVTLDELMAAKN